MRAPFVALDDARPGRERLLRYRDPKGSVAAWSPAEVAPALAAIEAAQARGLHAAGYFSYELGYALEPRLAPLMPAGRKLPLLWFGLFGARETHENAHLLGEAVAGHAYAGPLRDVPSEDAYAPGFLAVKALIAAGDTYQINLSFRARFSFLGDPIALYLRMRARAGAGFGAYVEDGERAILSLSPELFFACENGVATARPMKGTVPRGPDAAEDARLRARLQASEKDRAENLMIVDLIRNDLGRVARTGGITVEDLFAVETYPTLHTMVSTVRAELRDRVGPADLVRALFPCGSITGAPKIRAMEIIRDLEPDPRGVYCGAVGAFGPDGSALFNVAIRTVTIANGVGELGVGGGLVQDSRLASEYEECLVKARYFTETREPIGLIETLRHDEGQGFARLDLHLARLAASARALGIACDLATARRALDRAVAGAAGAWRVRLLLAENGELSCTAAPLEAAPKIWSYAISERRVTSTDALLGHKTTWRTLYDGEREAHARAQGCDEVIFLNERGEVTEGSRANVFALLRDKLVTPALSCGLLDGCLRREMLDAGLCQEGVLTPGALHRADKVYFGNSLRGLIVAVPAAVRVAHAAAE